MFFFYLFQGEGAAAGQRKRHAPALNDEDILAPHAVPDLDIGLVVGKLVNLRANRSKRAGGGRGERKLRARSVGPAEHQPPNPQPPTPSAPQRLRCSLPHWLVQLCEPPCELPCAPPCVACFPLRAPRPSAWTDGTAGGSGRRQRQEAARCLLLTVASATSRARCSATLAESAGLLEPEKILRLPPQWLRAAFADTVVEFMVGEPVRP